MQRSESAPGGAAVKVGLETKHFILSGGVIVIVSFRFLRVSAPKNDGWVFGSAQDTTLSASLDPVCRGLCFSASLFLPAL